MGLLIPETRDPPIPISVEVEQSGGKLSGRVTTSPPLTGEGRLVLVDKKGSECTFSSDIGVGRTLKLDGYCLSTTIEGTYSLRFPDGTLRGGHFRLARADSAKASPRKGPSDLTGVPVRTTSCLTANAACLAACPRGDYNAEFLCSNRCRQRFTACKAGAQSMLEAPAESATR